MRHPGAERLKIRPSALKEANAFVLRLHRHHKKARGCKFCLAVTDINGEVRGVAIVSRPVSRILDDGFTAEVVRLATDGTKNACSALYGAAWRAARAMGYRKLVTYTLRSEPGTSLRGAGWREVGEAGGGLWSRRTRERLDNHPTELKTKWERSI